MRNYQNSITIVLVVLIGIILSGCYVQTSYRVPHSSLSRTTIRTVPVRQPRAVLQPVNPLPKYCPPPRHFLPRYRFPSYCPPRYYRRYCP